MASTRSHTSSGSPSRASSVVTATSAGGSSPAYHRCRGRKPPSSGASVSANSSSLGTSLAYHAGPGPQSAGAFVNVLIDQLEPVEPVAGQGDEVRQLADRRERHPAGQLYRHLAGQLLEHQLARLGEARQVVDAQDDVLLAVVADPPAQVGEHRRVLRVQHL